MTYRFFSGGLKRASLVLMLVFLMGVPHAGAASSEELLGAICEADWERLLEGLNPAEAEGDISQGLAHWLKAHASLGVFRYEDSLRYFLDFGELNDLSPVTEWLGQAQAQQCRSSAILALMADASLRLGQAEQAEQYVSEAVQQKPLLAVTLDVLGMVIAKIGRLDLAFEHFLGASVIDPDYLNSQVNVMIVLLTLGATDAGDDPKADLDTWGSDYPIALNVRAVITSLARNYDGAEEDLLAAISQAPRLEVSARNLETVRWFKAQSDLIDVVLVPENLDSGVAMSVSDSSAPSIPVKDAIAAHNTMVGQAAIRGWEATRLSEKGIKDIGFHKTVEQFALSAELVFKSSAQVSSLFPNPLAAKIASGTFNSLGGLAHRVAVNSAGEIKGIRDSTTQRLAGVVAGNQALDQSRKEIERMLSAQQFNSPQQQPLNACDCGGRGGVKMRAEVVRKESADFSFLLTGETEPGRGTTYSLEVPYLLFAE